MSFTQEEEAPVRVARAPTKASRPSRSAKPSAPAPLRPREMPFDPNELSKRLLMVQAEQRGQQERKRRARAEAAAASAAAEKRKLAGAEPAKTEVQQQQKKSLEDATTARAQISSSSSNESAKKIAAGSVGNLIVDLNRSKSSRLRKTSRMDLVAEGSTQADTEHVAYKHVPKEAARQFARTTTPANATASALAHKLSRRGLKFHTDGVPTDRTAKGDANLMVQEQTNGLRPAHSQRERHFDRNQFQHTRILEEVAEAEAERHHHNPEPKEHTFEGEIARLKAPPHNADRQARRNSTGDMLDKVEDTMQADNRRSLNVADLVVIEEDYTPPEELPVPDRLLAHEHRVDWTQSDESSRPKLLSPLLRKADSIWTLRGRVGSKGSHERSELAPVAEGPKSPKAGFFAKFRR